MDERRKGELYAILLSILESWFPILSTFSIVLIGSLNSYAGVVTVATLVLLLILGIREGFAALFKAEAQKDLLLTAFFITLLFCLVFLGLRETSAGHMSVILMLQLLFSYLFFNVIGNEPMTRTHTLGAFMMGAGAIIMLFPDHFSFNRGDWLILFAAAIAPLANLFQKRARTWVSSLVILTYRNLIALPVLFTLAWYFEGWPGHSAAIQALPWILVIGTLIYVGAKILWIESLHRIGVTKLSAMIAFMPIFTLIFAHFTLGEVPSLRALLGILPILAGSYLITR